MAADPDKKQKQPARNRAAPELKQNKKPERSGRPLRLRPPRSVNGQETETAAIRHASRNISVSTHAPARDATKNRKRPRGSAAFGDAWILIFNKFLQYRAVTSFSYEGEEPPQAAPERRSPPSIRRCRRLSAAAPKVRERVWAR